MDALFTASDCGRLGARFVAFFAPARDLVTFCFAAISLPPVPPLDRGVYSGVTGWSRTAGLRGVHVQMPQVQAGVSCVSATI